MASLGSGYPEEWLAGRVATLNLRTIIHLSKVQYFDTFKVCSTNFLTTVSNVSLSRLALTSITSVYLKEKRNRDYQSGYAGIVTFVKELIFSLALP